MKPKPFFAAVLFLLVSIPGVTQDLVTLEQAVTLALEKNYDVNLARNFSEAAHTDDDYAWAAFAPQVSGIATTLWNTNQQRLRFQDDSRNNNGLAQNNNTSASIQAVWTLFDGTRMFYTRRRVDAAAGASDLAVKEQMTNTIASVISNYYDIVRQKQQLKAILEQMSVSEERVRIAERKLDVGTGIKPELLQAKVDLNAQRAQAIQQESTIAQLKAQLNELTGLQLSVNYEVADTILIDLNLTREAIFPNVENTNFTLRRARENVNIANLALSERRGEYFPRLDVNAAYNFNQNNNTRLLNPFSPVFIQSQGLNYGLTLTVPIFNALTTRRLTQLAQIEADRQTLLLGQAKNNINVALSNAFINYENAKRILAVEEETIGLAKENVFIALESFKRGVATFIELRTAQQSLEEAYNRLIAARFNAKVAETELLRLSGKLIQ